MSIFLIHICCCLSAQVKTSTSGFFPNDTIVEFNPIVPKKSQTWICINCDDISINELWKKHNGKAIPLKNRSNNPNTWADGPFVRNIPDWLNNWLNIKPYAKRQNLDKVNVVRVRSITTKDTTEHVYHIGVGIKRPKGTITFFDYNTLWDFVGPNGHYGPGDGFHDTTILHLPDQTLVIPKFQENNYLVNAHDNRNFYERPITVSIYNNNNQLILQDKVAVGLSAGSSIHFPNKGFQISARKSLNKRKKITTSVYGNAEKFKNLRFRAGGTSQLNHEHTCSFLNDPISLDITQYARNEYNTLYINGVYWTLDYIQEKMDEHWVEKHFQFNSKYVDIVELDNSKGIDCNANTKQLASLDSVVNKTELNIFSQKAYTSKYCECGSVKDGNGKAFGKLAEQILKGNIESINLKSVWDYVMFVRFLQNTDMGINNTFMFCDNRNNPTWYMFGNDFDQAFYGSATQKNGEWNKLIYSNKKDLFSRIVSLALKNNSDDFLRRAQDLLNTTLLPEKTIPIANKRIAELNHGIDKQFYSWHPNISNSSEIWTAACSNENYSTYLSQKPIYLRNSIANDFYPNSNWNSANMFKIEVELNKTMHAQNDDIYIQLNSLKIDSSWSGFYFPKPSVKISMNLPNGYRLKNWDELNHNKLNFEIELKKNLVLKPIIEKVRDYSRNVSQLQITEVYASAIENEFDWIEIYNPTNDTIDISGLFLSDNQNNIFKHKIPNSPSNLVPSKGFKLVYCSGNVKLGSNHSNFKLSGTNGEEVTLSNKDGEIINSLNFPPISINTSYGLCNSKKIKMSKITPGATNSCN